MFCWDTLVCPKPFVISLYISLCVWMWSWLMVHQWVHFVHCIFGCVGFFITLQLLCKECSFSLDLLLHKSKKRFRTRYLKNLTLYVITVEQNVFVLKLLLWSMKALFISLKGEDWSSGSQKFLKCIWDQDCVMVLYTHFIIFEASHFISLVMYWCKRELWIKENIWDQAKYIQYLALVNNG